LYLDDCRLLSHGDPANRKQNVTLSDKRGAVMTSDNKFHRANPARAWDGARFRRAAVATGLAAGVALLCAAAVPATAATVPAPPFVRGPAGRIPSRAGSGVRPESGSAGSPWTGNPYLPPDGQSLAASRPRPGQ
jgi:hypothetical protein